MRARAWMFVALAAAACTDGTAPELGVPGPSVAFSFHSGAGSTSHESAALGEAFDKVDRYQLTIRGVVSGTVFFEGTIEVTPGAEFHVLEVDLPEEAAGRKLTVDLVALQGTTELFRSTVEITAGSAGDEPLSASIPIRYTGPGIRGSVTDADGNGLSDVTVALLQGGVTVEETSTSSDGSFLFTDLAAGSYVVRPSPGTGLTACPGQRQVDLGAGSAVVAGFLIRQGDCIVRLLILSGGDVDDTETTAAHFTGLSDVSVSRFFVVSTAPTLDQLRQHDVVLVYQNGLFEEAQTVGTRLAEFADLGGSVVFGSFFWQGRSDSGERTSGWGSLEALDPFVSTGGAVYEAGSLGTVQAHEMTTGLTSLTSTGLWGGVSAKTGTTVLASWDDGTPLLGYAGGAAGQRFASVSLFPAHAAQCCVTGDATVLWRNVVRWAGAAGGPARSGVAARANR